jgi:hypothetical protein
MSSDEASAEPEPFPAARIINSIFSFETAQPPCCLDFCPQAPDIFAVGCYKLLKDSDTSKYGEEEKGVKIISLPGFDTAGPREGDEGAEVIPLPVFDNAWPGVADQSESDGSKEVAFKSEKIEEVKVKTEDEAPKSLEKDNVKIKAEGEEEALESEENERAKVEFEDDDDPCPVQASAPAPQRRIGLLYLFSLFNDDGDIRLYVPSSTNSCLSLPPPF